MQIQVEHLIINHSDETQISFLFEGGFITVQLGVGLFCKYHNIAKQESEKEAQEQIVEILLSGNTDYDIVEIWVEDLDLLLKEVSFTFCLQLILILAFFHQIILNKIITKIW